MNKRFTGKQEIPHKTNKKVFRAIYKSDSNFDCEPWVLNQRQRSDIQAVKMKYLRRVMVVTKRGKVRNVDFRRDLKIEPTLQFTVERQFSLWTFCRDGKEKAGKENMGNQNRENKKRGRLGQIWIKTIASSFECKVQEEDLEICEETAK